MSAHSGKDSNLHYVRGCLVASPPPKEKEHEESSPTYGGIYVPSIIFFLNLNNSNTYKIQYFIRVQNY